MMLDLHRAKALWAGLFERQVLEALVELARRSDGPIWDVGANVGYHTLALARIRPVVAIEPVPELADLVRRHAALNKLPVTVVEAAVADRVDAPYRLRRSNVDLGMSRLARGDGEPVKITTLDELAKQYGVPGLVKMDIEGEEVLALRAADSLFSARCIFVVESHGVDGELRAIFTRAGYTFRELDQLRRIGEPA